MPDVLLWMIVLADAPGWRRAARYGVGWARVAGRRADALDGLQSLR